MTTEGRTLFSRGSTTLSPLTVANHKCPSRTNTASSPTRHLEGKTMKGIMPAPRRLARSSCKGANGLLANPSTQSRQYSRTAR